MAKRKTDAPRQTDQCPHVFIGNVDGVKCASCGLELTTEEFREHLKVAN